jgi:predicted CopG family antitoxin
MPKITIEKDLYEKIRKATEEVGYSSVDEFVVHAIERELKRVLAGEEDEEVRKRLKGLGYIS